MSIGESLQRVFDAQAGIKWTPGMTTDDPAVAPRTAAVIALRDQVVALLPHLDPQPFTGRWAAKHGVGQGNAAKVPWVRVHDATSPRTTEGWYPVYLFSEDGRRVYLSLAHGVSGDKPAVDRGEAMRLLGVSGPPIPDGDPGLGTSPLAGRYTSATAWARRYDSGSAAAIPDQQYVDDLQEALRHLQTVQRKAGTAEPIAEERSREDQMDVVEALIAYRNVVLEGVAGTGKSHTINRLRGHEGFRGGVEVVVFHPATAYEDFVEGLRPRGETFTVQDGVFLDLCRRAAKRHQDTFVLVIDEINRANTAKVLGDLLYAIEPSKRVPAQAAQAILGATVSDPVTPHTFVRLQVARPVPGDPDRTYRQRFCVPDNVLILGTMNTSDRSVGSIDLALRRRFVFQRVKPMPANELIKAHPEMQADIETWTGINDTLAGIGPDALLGHSYFFEFADAAQRRRDHAAGQAAGPGDGGGAGPNIWGDLLLPQVAEILIAFNALHLLDDLPTPEATGGYRLSSVGEGLDAYPVVVPPGKAG